MKSLLWKQWQESKTYLVIFLVWAVLAAIYCVAYEFGYRFRAPVGHFSGLASFYTVCAAIFLAMRASQGEQTAGTLSFSASLPVSMRRIAAVRIAGAVATLAIPILVAAALLSLALVSGLVEQVAPRDAYNHIRLPQRETASLLTALEQLASVTAIAILGGIELLLMLSLIGCRLRSKAQVGLLGAVMALGSMIASGLFWYGERRPYAQLAYGAVFPQSLMIDWGYGVEHGGYTDHELAQYRWLALGFSIPVLIILSYLFVTQYGRLRSAVSAAKPGRFRFRTPSLWSRIPMRFSGRWSALVWLELRQSGPLVTFGLLFALLIAVASVMMEPQANYSVLAEMPHTIAFVGMLWAAVVGSALYSAELGSGLGGFWRSRPISSGRWFWCKFIVGLAAVLIVLDVATILTSWNTPRYSLTTGMSWAYVGCFPIIHALMYALAVLGTCWLRKPVIGAFLAILGYAVLTIAITAFPMTDSLEPINIYNKLLQAERAGNNDFAQHGYPLVYGVLAVSVLMLGVISSRLARPLEPTFRRFTLLVE
jgi:ABC-type transport system involved in multi-copper enzyme maturation permease subunit